MNAFNVLIFEETANKVDVVILLALKVEVVIVFVFNVLIFEETANKVDVVIDET